MADRILSMEELDNISNELEYIREDSEYALVDLKTMVESFNNQEIVNSFYKSGKYGADIQRTMEALLTAFNKYEAVISEGNDSLVSQTKKYVQRQIELNENGN